MTETEKEQNNTESPRASRRTVLKGTGAIGILGMTDGAAGQQTDDEGDEEVTSERSRPADLIVFNGKIVTMNNRRVDMNVGNICSAMAIRGNEIQQLGSNDLVDKGSRNGTKLIDLEGRTVIPGIIDVHTHPESFISFYRHNLTRDTFIPEGSYTVDYRLPIDLYQKQVEETIEAAVELEDEGNWLFITSGGPHFGTGGGRSGREFELESQLFHDEITREKLTELAPNHPLIVGTYNGVANDSAIAILEEGLPKDISQKWEEKNWELGVPAVMYNIPYEVWGRKAGIDRMIEVQRVELEMFPKVGITTFSTRFATPTVFEVYQRMQETGQLPVRATPANEFLRWHPSGKKLKAARTKPVEWGSDDEWIWIQGVAYESGWWSTDRGGDKNGWESVVEAINKGWRPAHLHIFIDDWMGRQFVELLKDTDLTKEEIRKLRPHGLHFTGIQDIEVIEELADWGVHVSCGGTTSFGFPDGRGGGHNPGIPVKTGLEKGLHMVAESDQINTIGSQTNQPFNLTEILTTREWETDRPYGGGTLDKDEAIPREMALKMQTTWASETLLKEDRIGSLEEGKLADFIVLNQDILTVPEKEIHDTRPYLTVLDGEIVYTDGTLSVEAFPEKAG